MQRLGICPDRKVSEEEMHQAKVDIGYIFGRVNIGVVGVRGAGKSTMINCLRGVEAGDATAASVGEVENTVESTQYIDDRYSNNVYYDHPGGAVMNVTAWNYYYRQRLFAYDKLLLVHTDTPTEVCLRY